MRGGCVQSAGDEPITAHHVRGAPAGGPDAERGSRPSPDLHTGQLSGSGRERSVTPMPWAGPPGRDPALRCSRGAALRRPRSPVPPQPRPPLDDHGSGSRLRPSEMLGGLSLGAQAGPRPRVDSESPGPRAERRGAGGLGPAGLRPGPTLVGRAGCRGTRICAGPLDFRVDASSRLCPCMPVWSCADAQRFCAREGRAGRVAAVAEGPWRGPPSESTFPSRLRRFPRTSATACAITRVLWAAPPL